MKNNIVLVGNAIGTNKFDLEGHKFIEMLMLTKRLSGTVDSMPVLCREDLIPEGLEFDTTLPDSTDAKRLRIEGEIRTRNVHVNNHSKLVVYVYAKKIEIVDETVEDENKAELEGAICRMPVYRITPNKIHITDIFIAVNSASRPYYIPCIAFNKVAKNANKLEVGDIIDITCRFQSRTYEKKIDEVVTEMRVAYEMSIAHLEKTGSNKKNDDDISIDDSDLFN